MCSSILQICFNVGVLAGMVLTIIALAIPGWTKYEYNGKEIFSRGFFDCASEAEQCVNKLWSELEPWKKVTVAALIISIGFSLTALIFSTILGCCLCCLKGCFGFFLPLFAALACISDIVAISVYGSKTAQDIDVLTYLAKPTLGSAMWVGTVAILVLFADTILGIYIARVSSVSPI